MSHLRKALLMIVLCAALLSAKADDVTIDFSEGKWDKSTWKVFKCFPTKPVERLKDFYFSQKKDCISYDCSAEDLKRGDDNCILVYDTGRNEAEFEVVLESGKGHPGILISPEFSDDGILLKGYCVFVADYTIAAWYVDADPVKKSSTYSSLVQITRWQPKLQKHKITCRYDKRGFAIKVDDSDTVVLHPKWDYGMASVNGFKVNTKIGIWGCHGLCNFYSLVIKEKGLLLFDAVDPNAKK